MKLQHGETRLSESEVATYYEEGLVVPDYRIPNHMLRRMQASLERLINNNPEISPDIMVCPHIATGGGQGLRGGSDWLEYAKCPEILDLVEQLIGPDILLWGTTVFCKSSGTGKEVPWHQDAEYWPIRPPATCSVWIALDDVTPENGCMRYIPGSHKSKRHYTHSLSDRDDLALREVLDEDQFDGSAAKDVLLRAGQISLHDVYLIHGSAPNRSTRRRAGFVLRLMPTTSHFDHQLGAVLTERAGLTGVADLAHRALFLVRGVDKCGLNNFIIGHDSYVE